MNKKVIIALVVTAAIACAFVFLDGDAKERNKEFDRKHESAEDYTMHEESCRCAECYVVHRAIEVRNAVEENETYGSGLRCVSIEYDSPVYATDGTEYDNHYNVIVHFEEGVTYVPDVGEVWSLVENFSDLTENSVVSHPYYDGSYTVKVTNNPYTPMGDTYILN